MTLLRGRNTPVIKFPLKWANEYLDWHQIPTIAFPIDVTEGTTNIGMMGNDTYGDCGSAAEVHIEITTAIASGVAPPAPTSDLAVQRYVAFTNDPTPPGPGVDLASYLLWLYQQRIIKAFAPVDHTNKAIMCDLMAAGFGLYIGVNLTDSNEDQFSAGQPFTGAGGPDPNDGHCVVWAACETPEGPHKVGTWGCWWPTDDTFIENCLVNNPNGEAFLVVTTEEQLAKFQPALLRDVAALGGTGGAGATTPPAQPQAPPKPPEGVRQWLHDMLAWLESLGA